MRSFSRWRRLAATALLVSGCLAATLSVAVIWLHETVIDTDKYVETVAPLSEDAVIKDALAARITSELFARANATELARKALPDQADFLAPPIVSATESFVRTQIREELDSDRFSSFWEQGSRKGHETVRRVLLGESKTVTVNDGRVTVDLESLYDEIKLRLAGMEIELLENTSLPVTETSFTVFESEGLARVQDGISLLNRLAFWLPLLALVLLVAAVWLSANRAIALLWTGLGISTGMVLLLVGLSLLNGYYLDSVRTAKNIDVDVAASFFNVFADSFRTTLRRVFLAGLLLAAAGFALSPYPLSTRLRSRVRSLCRAGIERGARVDLGPAGGWVSRQKGPLRIAGVALALVILINIDEPSLSRALLITAVLGLYLAAVEFISRKAA